MILCHLGPDFLDLPTFDANQIISHSLSSMINIVLLPDNEKPVIQGKFSFLSVSEFQLDKTIYNGTKVC